MGTAYQNSKHVLGITLSFPLHGGEKAMRLRPSWITPTLIDFAVVSGKKNGIELQTL